MNGDSIDALDAASGEPTDPSAAGNIVLTGFMGTGKSTIGRLLAGLIDFAFVDTDDVIESRHGPITTIFDDHGEARFRSIERTVAAELARCDRTVIATGGRMMLDPHNVEVLSRRGRVFCLTATPGDILARVTADDHRSGRPLLAGPDPAAVIADLLDQRRAGYGRFEQVETGTRSPQATAAEIAVRLRSLQRPGAETA
ncbi:MAG: shikimate kinase [Ilumatobacteraceae bacterium]